MAETQEQMVERWEAEGWLDPKCEECREFYTAAMPTRVFAPHHRASAACESGKRPHCTCDRCF